LECGQIVSVTNDRPYTVADGLKAQLGAMQFPILRDLTNDVLVATDGEILHATKLLWERLNVIVEPSAAIGFAVLLSDEFQEKYSPQNGIYNVGVILCGGNCDIQQVTRQF
jgi:threonine dehydratase